MRYLSVVLTVIFVTYGQLILKHEMKKMDPAPVHDIASLAKFFLEALANLGVWSGLAAAALAALAWIYSLNRFDLSAIYPLLSINFVLVPVMAVFLFREQLTVGNMVGISLIVLGIVVFARGG